MLKRKNHRYKQGNVYWYDFGAEDVVGVQGGVHPCIVVSNDLFNRYSPVVNVVAISSHAKTSPVHVLIPGCLSDQDSFAYCEQWVTVNKTQLMEYICTLDENVLENVIDRLIYQITHKAKLKGKWIGREKEDGKEIKSDTV